MYLSVFYSYPSTLLIPKKIVSKSIYKKELDLVK